MKTMIKITLLSVAGIALLATPPASAKPTLQHATHMTARAHGYPAGGAYLLENRDGTGGNASANTNTAESFQDQFAVDY
jgi:hypothetical protein